MEEIKPIVMAEILKIKFVQCDEFRQKLMRTNGYIAHNVNDNFWGTGKDGKGMNVFGTLLAALRLGVNLWSKHFVVICIVITFHLLQ